MFKYETHCHTSEVSKCAIRTAVDTVEFYKNRGYDGIFITDHFLNGNTAVNRNQPWENKIKDFCISYELAKKQGDQIGIDVFFGWEYTYNYRGKGDKYCGGNDFLTYGLDKEWLLSHPEIMELELHEYCEFIRSEGGFIIHAHPFRDSSYIDMIRLAPNDVDGIEVLNSSRPESENKIAEIFADHYGLLKTSGSDNHGNERPLISGIMTKTRITSPKDMLAKLKSGETEIFVENLY